MIFPDKCTARALSFWACPGLSALLWLLIGSCWSYANEEAIVSAIVFEGLNQHRPQQNQQVIGRRYLWNFKEQSFTVILEIGTEHYNSYSTRERQNIPAMVQEGINSLEKLGDALEQIILRKQWSETEGVEFIAGMVQSLPYTSDKVTTGFDEFRRFGLETLVEGGGDCEDTTILTAALLHRLGYPQVLVHLPGHIAVGVAGPFQGSCYPHSGHKYYYLETTGAGWQLGEIPESFADSPARLTVLDPTAPGSISQVPYPTLPDPAPSPKPGSVASGDQESGGENRQLFPLLVLMILLAALGAVLVGWFFNRQGEVECESYCQESESGENEWESSSQGRGSSDPLDF